MAFSNGTRDIDREWDMADVVVRHSQNGNSRAGNVSTFHLTISLVNSRLIVVHETGKPTMTWHFFTSGLKFDTGWRSKFLGDGFGFQHHSWPQLLPHLKWSQENWCEFTGYLICVRAVTLKCAKWQLLDCEAVSAIPDAFSVVTVPSWRKAGPSLLSPSAFVRGLMNTSVEINCC